jgi:hypothetical protein
MWGMPLRGTAIKVLRIVSAIGNILSFTHRARKFARRTTLTDILPTRTPVASGNTTSTPRRDGELGPWKF